MTNEANAEVEPKDIIDLCSSNLQIARGKMLRLLKSKLRAPESLIIASEKIQYSNLPIVTVNIPIEMRARLLILKGQPKRAQKREIDRLEKAQRREIARTDTIRQCALEIQRLVSDGCAVMCTSENIDVVHASRRMRV